MPIGFDRKISPSLGGIIPLAMRCFPFGTSGDLARSRDLRTSTQRVASFIPHQFPDDNSTSTGVHSDSFIPHPHHHAPTPFLRVWGGASTVTPSAGRTQFLPDDLVTCKTPGKEGRHATEGSPPRLSSFPDVIPPTRSPHIRGVFQSEYPVTSPGAGTCANRLARS